MAENKKKRYYPCRDAKNCNHVHLEEVSEELYKDICPEIWREQKRRQKNGQCRCPKSMLWACDADCVSCEFQTSGNHVSLDTSLEDATGLTVVDTIRTRSRSPEAIVIDMYMMEALYQELELLDPEGKRICKLIMEGKSERKAAIEMNMPRSTFKLHWNKIKAQLYEKLKEWQD